MLEGILGNATAEEVLLYLEPFLEEVRALLRKALRALPEAERRRYFVQRRRPRRAGKRVR